MHEGLYDRSQASDQSLESYRTSLDQVAAEFSDKLCIYITGSYGRGEASDKSDVDLFFVSPDKSIITRENELTLFGDLVKMNRSLGKPKFSRDCTFLKIHHADELLDRLGHPEDDSGNTFTARMLLLLEGRCLINEEIFENLVDQILKTYFSDYMMHSPGFVPRFFFNDITRFWKTLCLNYEAFCDKSSKTKERIQNLKLRFARKLTCFSTIVAVLALREFAPAKVKEIVNKKPWERLYFACDGNPDASAKVDGMAECYLEFLKLVDAAKENDTWVMPIEDWTSAKEHSLRFGAKLVELMQDLGGSDALQVVAL